MNPLPIPQAVLRETASQTAGPYVHIGLAPQQAGFDIFQCRLGSSLLADGLEGQAIVLHGQVLDGAGAPVRDALLEIWQADAHGRYAGAEAGGFRGWARACTDFDSGGYRFDTIKPGRVMGRDGRWMAPHINVWLVARGINLGLHTRIYFADEAEANAADPVLNLIDGEARRQTLLALPDSSSDGLAYRFDIHLQGERETVFFEL
ncbi:MULTISPECIES: protocatechuate 3,4-dioxygenase subunit alpha [Chromobacterium]|uniref:Protocatechuate 3,4-dioxygenase subunit alpha n=2 Tax=Chromobacterium TaxID=535 RepID=A0ABS3GPZ6_9NEIS|nr:MULTISPECIES: protocatechuate 3,4-dioxygenase subunit alpha [Chromobacterium]AXT46688.1 protocatechuate 3,4-dioxygenase subunit alpha [Chromobacterium rhizoryzae]MBK0415111.1 protocatechuate 3,4-dioxygenase subunit alpha [Chromobacterium haemolyticum]MBO0416675.1 protocatechuate 3,4-dioxygenase subunit alpha [Chromobacterium haemolyticum]MBO0499749.1 protocatechuate 3,4-dioxygenase subunit alpha [Chromobacterium haemolyticum]BBH13014.1 protocatechuate 3,4-dioxygenase subunit alpha [Chromoba